MRRTFTFPETELSISYPETWLAVSGGTWIRIKFKHFDWLPRSGSTFHLHCIPVIKKYCNVPASHLAANHKPETELTLGTRTNNLEKQEPQ